MHSGWRKRKPHAGHRQRKKEQFRRHGLDAFAPHEALELLLYYAIPRVDTNGMAHALLRRFGSLDGVFRAPVEELMQVEGIGENAALLIRLVPQLISAQPDRIGPAGVIIKDYESAGHFFLKYFWGERTEIVLELCVDGKGRMLGCHRLSQGGSSAAAFNVRDAVRYALADNAVSVYLAHNHPSGYAVPSEQDYAATWTVRESLRTVGVELLDHFCGGGQRFCFHCLRGVPGCGGAYAEVRKTMAKRQERKPTSCVFWTKSASLMRPTAIRTRKGRQ